MEGEGQPDSRRTRAGVPPPSPSSRRPVPVFGADCFAASTASSHFRENFGAAILGRAPAKPTILPMQQARRKVERKRPPFVLRLGLRISASRQIAGFGSVRRTGSATRSWARRSRPSVLIKDFDRRRYNRSNAPPGAHLGKVASNLELQTSEPSLNACELDYTLRPCGRRRRRCSAACIVHEATRARLWRSRHRLCGKAAPAHRAVCFRQEPAFAARLTVDRQLMTGAQPSIAPCRRRLNTERAKLFAERLTTGSDCRNTCSHLGIPTWIARTLQAPEDVYAACEESA